jgi:hypothetical protein
VNEFVEECRSEWKRLGVPDPVANEMAADLTADLEEAEAEGASVQDVLGSGAFDARSFAGAWAAERGVIRRPPEDGHGLPRRSRIAAATAAFAVIAVIGAVLVILAAPSAPRLAVASPVGPPLRVVLWPAPPPGARGVVVAADMNDVLPPLPPPGARIVAMDMNDSGVDTRTVGSVLLTVGLAGVVPLTMLWLWVGPGRWSRPRTHIDDRPSGPAY